MTWINADGVFVKFGRETAQPRPGGEVQSVSDATSITRYRARRRTVSDLVCLADVDVRAVAELDLARFKDSEYRFRQLSIDPVVFPTVMWPHACGRQIRDRATIYVDVPVSGQSIVADAFIEGIRHSISVIDATWMTTFSFSLMENPVVTSCRR